MKHYICMEEHTITYFRSGSRRLGSQSASEDAVIQDLERMAAGRNPDMVLGVLAKKHGLSGKKVTLVLGRDVRMLSLLLPKAGKAALKKMACNELTAMGLCDGDFAAAVDIRNAREDGPVPVTVYYIGKGCLKEHLDACSRAGMTCGPVRVLSDCMAVMSLEMYKENPVMLIDVQEEHIGFYILSHGHCLSAMQSSLKAARFCEKKAMDILYEEIADEAEQVLKLADNSEETFDLESVILNASCLPDPDKAAVFLKKRLGLPCQIRDVVTSAGNLLGKGISRKRRAVELYGGGNTGSRDLLRALLSSVSKKSVLFLSANILAAAVVCMYTGYLQAAVKDRVSDLKASMNGKEYKEMYRSARKIERELQDISKQEAESERIRENAADMNLLGIEAYAAFADAMDPDMKMESIAYQQEGRTLRVIISMADPASIPGFVERVRSTGTFSGVSHSLWEKKEVGGETERCYASFEALLESGGQNEAE